MMPGCYSKGTLNSILWQSKAILWIQLAFDKGEFKKCQEKDLQTLKQILENGNKKT